MVKQPSNTDKLKRLVQSGQYRIDPVAVADAMIRRGWALDGGPGPRDSGPRRPNRTAGGNGAA